jgi:alginate O-acetyltransferase complex protein AlgI
MLCYFISPRIGWRNGVLIAFSLLFYAWGEPVYLFLMLATVTVNYGMARLIGKRKGTPTAKAALIVTAVFNLGALGLFKYGGMFTDAFNALTGLHIPGPGLALPIGISFYTFQVFSYVIDVYRGETEAQRSFPKLLLFVTLFHQLVAGPIVRYNHIAAEIDRRSADAAAMWAGIERFVAGLFKKAVLANICGSLAATYLDPARLGSLAVLEAWFGIVMFALQIYFDFSAYSDMAIGMGHMIGFHYHENFNYPYTARSVSEFWRRWHMSLGTFFRDYVYIPLGGNRRRMYLNLLIVWFLTGLWHGASWNFVLWGLYFFVFIALEKLFLRRWLEKIPRALSHLYLVLVALFGWVFFYYTDLGEAMTFFARLFGVGASGWTNPGFETTLLNNMFFIALAVAACFPLVRPLKNICRNLERRGLGAARTVFGLRCVSAAALLFVSTVMLVGNSYNPFIYFRF